MEKEKNKINGGTLYLVATPIGNLADISERALKTLSEVDFVAAEDTRNTTKLLAYFGIKKPLVSYYEHNKAKSGQELISRLKSGESCALVTDAGMPGISDPGEDMVALCVENDIPVTIVPGACAAVAALVLSGLATGKFVFEGFLSAKSGERKKRLEELKNEQRTIIFYEAPHKLRETLSAMKEIFGESRKISLCRELTKINEEIIRTTLGAAVEKYASDDPRGEYVLVLEGGSAEEGKFWEKMTVEAHVSLYEAQGLTKNEAIKAAAKDRGVPKNEIYGKIMKK